MLHNVYFWLKKEVTSDQRALFEEELALLKKIPYLVDGQVGKPAKTEERPVTDHSFDYSLLLRFANMEDHEHYQKGCEHHQRFVEKCRPFFERVVVYDTAPME